MKPSITGMYGEEAAKNIIQSSHVAASHRSSQDYPKSEISTIWNDADAWREKSFESNSNKVNSVHFNKIKKKKSKLIS